MEYKRNRTEPIPFSLHDSHIQKMMVSDNALILKVNKVFQYTDTEQEFTLVTLFLLKRIWKIVLFLSLMMIFIEASSQER